MFESQSFEGPNRRKYPRLEYPFYMSYKKTGKKLKRELSKRLSPFYFTEKKDEKLSISHNISVGGICFVTKGKFRPKTKLSVKLWSPVTNKELIGLVEVRWQKAVSFKIGYLTGVAFISLEDKNELRRLLELFTDLKLEEMIEK